MSGRLVTGERVVTAAEGFNPTWQRHVAAYALCAPLLGPGRVLDLGCGVGHSFHLLAPRKTLGVDLDASALAGQQHETLVADMRSLPLAAASFGSVLAVQSIEHVPDPERVLAEVRRVLEPDGVAVFVTPNRLTFGRPDEIIDPYHFREYDACELAELLRASFADVDVRGIFGSERVQRLLADQRRTMERGLALDPLRLRLLLPRRARQRLYDLALTLSRQRPHPHAGEVGVEDFTLADAPLERALDLVAVARNT